MNLLSMVKGSLFQNLLPAGWDLSKIDSCASHSPEQVYDKQPHWHDEFRPVSCANLDEFNTI